MFDEFVIGVVKELKSDFIYLMKSNNKYINIEISDVVKSSKDKYVRSNQVKKNDIEIGDIIKIQKGGKISVLFKKNSHDNLLFTTNQCNSNCLMCSQPPKKVDDIEYFDYINNEILNLAPNTVTDIGISGGEPTLLGTTFIDLLFKTREKLPKTNVHILTNGKVFSDIDFVFQTSEVINENFVFGVPLYSDIPSIHDYMVQDKGAFYKTVSGIHNAASFSLNIEVRIVITKINYERLLDIAIYIYMNFPFVVHVAFMGLEYTGHTLINRELIEINPVDFNVNLREAINFLATSKINTSIYNIPMCLLDQSLWEYSVKSISDWKVTYIEECEKCSIKEKCGGIFSTSKIRYNNIKSILINE